MCHQCKGGCEKNEIGGAGGYKLRSVCELCVGDCDHLGGLPLLITGFTPRPEGVGVNCDHLGGLPSLKIGFTPSPEGVGVKLCHHESNMEKLCGGDIPTNVPRNTTEYGMGRCHGTIKPRIP